MSEQRALSSGESIASGENVTHCACLSGISMPCHPERCSGGSVTSNLAMHRNFGVKIHYILHFLLDAQSRSTAHSAVVPLHLHRTLSMSAFLVCLTFSLHFPTKNMYMYPRGTSLM